jgi:hypothetical protein
VTPAHASRTRPALGTVRSANAHPSVSSTSMPSPLTRTCQSASGATATAPAASARRAARRLARHQLRGRLGVGPGSQGSYAPKGLGHVRVELDLARRKGAQVAPALGEGHAGRAVGRGGAQHGDDNPQPQHVTRTTSYLELLRYSKVGLTRRLSGHPNERILGEKCVPER